MDLITKVQYEKQVNLIQRPSDMSLSNDKLVEINIGWNESFLTNRANPKVN